MTLNSYGQTNIKTKEIKIAYPNGYELFHICMDNPKLIFNDRKEYFWYTEYSKIKSTKGGSGGSLLHGNYKVYDDNGNLKKEMNYNLGLLHGSEKTWDSSGNTTSTSKYRNGEMIYRKFQDDQKYWIEFSGEIFKVGTTKKVYTRYNLLISEETTLSDFYKHTKTYFEPSGKLKEEFTKEFGTGYLIGKYTAYYENGKIKVEGKFFKGKNANVKVGIWKHYKSDETIDSTEQYKSGVEFWQNGELKVAGGFILKPKDKKWVKTGEWRWYNKEGKFESSKIFEKGVEIAE